MRSFHSVFVLSLLLKQTHAGGKAKAKVVGEGDTESFPQIREAMGLGLRDLNGTFTLMLKPFETYCSYFETKQKIHKDDIAAYVHMRRPCDDLIRFQRCGNGMGTLEDTCHLAYSPESLLQVADFYRASIQATGRLIDYMEGALKPLERVVLRDSPELQTRLADLRVRFSEASMPELRTVLKSHSDRLADIVERISRIPEPSVPEVTLAPLSWADEMDEEDRLGSLGETSTSTTLAPTISPRERYLSKSSIGRFRSGIVEWVQVLKETHSVIDSKFRAFCGFFMDKGRVVPSTDMEVFMIIHRSCTLLPDMDALNANLNGHLKACQSLSSRAALMDAAESALQIAQATRRALDKIRVVVETLGEVQVNRAGVVGIKVRDLRSEYSAKNLSRFYVEIDKCLYRFNDILAQIDQVDEQPPAAVPETKKKLQPQQLDRVQETTSLPTTTTTTVAPTVRNFWQVRAAARAAAEASKVSQTPEIHSDKNAEASSVLQAPETPLKKGSVAEASKVSQTPKIHLENIAEASSDVLQAPELRLKKGAAAGSSKVQQAPENPWKKVNGRKHK